MAKHNLIERKETRIRIGDMRNIVYVFSVKLQTTRSQHAHNTKHKVIDKSEQLWGMFSPINKFEILNNVSISDETTHKFFINTYNVGSIKPDMMIRDEYNYVYKVLGSENYYENYFAFYCKLLGIADVSIQDYLVIDGERIYYE